LTGHRGLIQMECVKEEAKEAFDKVRHGVSI
jgi:hypothetical protein